MSCSKSEGERKGKKNAAKKNHRPKGQWRKRAQTQAPLSTHLVCQRTKGQCRETGLPRLRANRRPRTHFSEKSAPPPKHGVGLSFPAFGFRMPEQKGWAELELETPKPLSDLKQKKRSPGVFSFEVAGNCQNELAGGPKVLLTATFWPTTFPGSRFHCPTFLPLILFGPRELALQWQCPD